MLSGAFLYLAELAGDFHTAGHYLLYNGMYTFKRPNDFFLFQAQLRGTPPVLGWSVPGSI